MSARPGLATADILLPNKYLSTGQDNANVDESKDFGRSRRQRIYGQRVVMADLDMVLANDITAR